MEAGMQAALGYHLSRLDVPRIACIALMFPVVRWVLNTHCYQPLAHRVLRPIWKQSTVSVTPERRQLAVAKFSESCWKLGVYLVFTGLGIASVWRQPFVFDTTLLWDGWPTHEYSGPMALLYNLELGFYISSIFMIIFWEVRRKDFAVMFSHHIATTLLVGTSLHFRCTRVGVLIMLLHDANDIFMEAAKLAKYGQRETTAVACFATFALTWLLTRLLFFPLVVIRSVLAESRTYVPLGNVVWAVFSSLLCTLLALHCYWYSLILRVAYIQLTVGEADDVREMDDDE